MKKTGKSGLIFICIILKGAQIGFIPVTVNCDPESTMIISKQKATLWLNGQNTFFVLLWWTTGKNAYYLLPKDKEIHFTAHIAHISLWDQFSCYMIVINTVAVRNLPPQITDMNDISSADCEFFLYLCSSSAQKRLFWIKGVGENKLLSIHQQALMVKNHSNGNIVCFYMFILKCFTAV